MNLNLKKLENELLVKKEIVEELFFLISLKANPNQPRDTSGRFGSGGGITEPIPAAAQEQIFLSPEEEQAKFDAALTDEEKAALSEYEKAPSHLANIIYGHTSGLSDSEKKRINQQVASIDAAIRKADPTKRELKFTRILDVSNHKEVMESLTDENVLYDSMFTAATQDQEHLQEIEATQKLATPGVAFHMDVPMRFRKAPRDNGIGGLLRRGSAVQITSLDRKSLGGKLLDNVTVPKSLLKAAKKPELAEYSSPYVVSLGNLTIIDPKKSKYYATLDQMIKMMYNFKNEIISLEKERDNIMLHLRSRFEGGK